MQQNEIEILSNGLKYGIRNNKEVKSLALRRLDY